MAEAVNCSGGSFHVQWVGHVKVGQTTSVSNQATLSIIAAPDRSSIIDRANETSHFELSRFGEKA